MAPGAIADPVPAAAGGKIGPGTACGIPATLSTAEKWSPKDLAKWALVEDGVTLRCEIDAKPAGVLGFIWVFTYESGDAAQALTTVAAMSGFGGEKSAERQITIGGKDGAEAALARDEAGPGRAFAANGVVVLWGSVDEEEFASGLPAYVLARTSITF
ncbi:hypothetical protein Ais01nite_00030 [Asanoa ishikariensis]|uniref:DUF3558 domain-containing protein n=1 Tax=Asanoa ishikariensis TaxID=137265 RepID=A0A1H3TQS5_9ACTN|nr:lipoprotein [Asanoa ishikariensis]GIF61968.1 hypothetical protein Ais01nite_00030 [Asanoa ishikariensis]SDZ52556.1 hypothetical protein SAMN05421684_6220 [Asanoa ishikariensis]